MSSFALAFAAAAVGAETKFTCKRCGPPSSDDIEATLSLEKLGSAVSIGYARQLVHQSFSLKWQREFLLSTPVVVMLFLFRSRLIRAFVGLLTCHLAARKFSRAFAMPRGVRVSGSSGIDCAVNFGGLYEYG